MTNVFAEIPPRTAEEQFITLLSMKSARLERIVSYGHASPEGFWYEQPQLEWVLLLRGAARIRFEDRVLEIGPGDMVSIAARQRHRVDWTMPDEPTVWLAIHYDE